ncbi:hypothetical protein [Rhizobium sp. RU36D]|nr:hypothetical protein [Rhizobium sp. RU36D]
MYLDKGLQPDWVHIEYIDTHDVSYFPYPIMLTSAQTAKLRNWV